jgi:murein DD-endopeptidase
MPKMPTLGPQPKKSPWGKVFLLALIGGGIAGGTYWYKNRAVETQPPAPASASTPAATPGPSDGLAALGGGVTTDAGGGMGAVVPTPMAGAPALPAPTLPKDPAEQAGLRRLSIRIDGPLESAIVAAAGKEIGPSLTQVITRTLVWWLGIPGDLRKGDALEALYEDRPGDEPLVHAVKFTSGKYEKTFQAFRFKAPSDNFHRYYLSNGEELEQRLVDSPLEAYEQITSLLRDGRRHKGVDFKTPVGSAVKAPFSGVITRKNWGFRANGNCLELTESGGHGRKAYFLHLSELPKSLAVGKHVSKGEVIASSGNTGRSFAPHLHYQLMQGERVLDPFDVQATTRRSLNGEGKTAFESEMRRLEVLFGPAVAGGNSL